MERVSDGELIVEGLDCLAPGERQKLETAQRDIHHLLLPSGTSTALIDLLIKFGVEPVYVDDKQWAVAEVQRICAASPRLDAAFETARYRSIFRKPGP